MREPRKVSIPVMVLRALGLGLVMTVVLPLVALYGVLALGHLSGGCGPGSSGGCEMGAAAVALYAAIPSFILGAGLSVFRDVRRGRP